MIKGCKDGKIISKSDGIVQKKVFHKDMKKYFRYTSYDLNRLTDKDQQKIRKEI